MSGQVVFGENYFGRRRDEEAIWRRLDRGSHLILLSPRRAGKTSLLRHLEENPKPGYVFLYVMVQSCANEHEFCREIIQRLHETPYVDRLKKASKKASEAWDTVMQQIQDIKFAGAEVTLKDRGEVLKCPQIGALLTKLDMDKKLVLVIDEFPDVIEKINEISGLLAVTSILAGLRTISQDKALASKVQFVFTGSIGLDTLANRLNVSNLINMLDKASLTELMLGEAEDFIDFLKAKNKSAMVLSADTKQRLIARVGWLMPYYLEILWEALEDICMDERCCCPDANVVDRAYEQLFSQIYRANFNHWVERLNRLGQQEARLAKAVLSLVAEQEAVHVNEIANLYHDARFQGIDGNYVLNCLEHDGYLFQEPEKLYRFTSPMLKDWWTRYGQRH